MIVCLVLFGAAVFYTVRALTEFFRHFQLVKGICSLSRFPVPEETNISVC